MTSAPRRNFAGCSGASQPASMMACEHTDPILKTATLLRRASSTASSKAHVGGDSNEVLNRRTGGERDGVDASLAHCPHERFRRSEVVGHRPSKRVGADGPPMEAACTPSGQERYLFVAAPICSNADGVASEGSEHGPMVRADCFLAIGIHDTRSGVVATSAMGFGEEVVSLVGAVVGEFMCLVRLSVGVSSGGIEMLGVSSGALEYVDCVRCIESGSSVVAEGTRPAGSTRLARLAEGIVPAGHCVQDLVVGAIADEDATGDLAVSDRDPAMHLAEWVGELQAVVGGFGTPKAGDLHPQQFELGGKLSSAEGGDAATQSVGHHSGHLVAGRDQPIDPLVMACYLADGRDRGGRWLRNREDNHVGFEQVPGSLPEARDAVVALDTFGCEVEMGGDSQLGYPRTQHGRSRTIQLLGHQALSHLHHMGGEIEIRECIGGLEAEEPTADHHARSTPKGPVLDELEILECARVTDVGRAAHETSDGLCVGPNLRTLQLRPGLYLPIVRRVPL
ncbi:hypothetical protein GQR58_030576 [Nymphon striatum]|nr:hypothetical protein GQR58_030576 [Nymphon striatum]